VCVAEDRRPTRGLRYSGDGEHRGDRGAVARRLRGREDPVGLGDVLPCDPSEGPAAVELAGEVGVEAKKPTSGTMARRRLGNKSSAGYSHS
jgi:hypothetical protein